MKATRLLGFAAIAALAVLALLLTGSASATELCNAAEDPCEVENFYEDGTVLKASSEKALFETSFGTITCTSSALEGESSATSGNPLPATFTKLGFGSCKLEAASCTAEASELPYYALIEKTGTNVASLELRGDVSAALTILLKCSGKKEINCTLTDEEIELEFKGGKPAQVVASKESFEKASGASCPEKTSLTATYSVTSPEQVQIARRGVKLCKVSIGGGTVCPLGEGFSGGIKGNILATTEVKILGVGEPGGNVKCTESSLTGSFGNDGKGEISAFVLKSPGGLCASTLGGGTPTVKTELDNLPANRASFSFWRAAAPQGLLTIGGTRNLKLKLVVTGMTTCLYRMFYLRLFVTNPTITPMGVEGSILNIGGRIGGSTEVCPPSVLLVGQWQIESAGGQNIWMSET